MVALAIWCGCVLLVVVKSVGGSSGTSVDSPFQQPVQTPRPHPGLPLKQ